MTARTILPGWCFSADWTEPRWAAEASRWGNPKNDFDLNAVDLNPSDEGSDDFPCAEPIEVIQAVTDFADEILNLTDDQRQLTLGSSPRRRPPATVPTNGRGVL